MQRPPVLSASTRQTVLQRVKRGEIQARHVTKVEKSIETKAPDANPPSLTRLRPNRETKPAMKPGPKPLSAEL